MIRRLGFDVREEGEEGRISTISLLSLLFKKKEGVPFSTATAFRFVKHRRDFTFEAFIDSSKP
jgi:hypothetical protein